MYKRDKEDLSSNLYSLLPETMETQFAKEMAETHSQVSLESVCLGRSVCVCVYSHSLRVVRRQIGRASCRERV